MNIIYGPKGTIKWAAKRTGPGDLIAKATASVGIKPCGGCKQRQQRLNKWWFELTDKLANAMK